MLDGVLNVLGWRDLDVAALDRAESSYVSHVAGVLGGHLREGLSRRTLDGPLKR